MKNNLLNLVQNCTYVDFLIDSLIDSYPYINVLSSIKEDNLRNTKIVIYLYESILNESIDFNNIDNRTLDTDENEINLLLKLFFLISSQLENIKLYNLNFYNLQVVQGLINSYLNFVSFIYNYFPLNLNKARESKNHNYRFFYMISEYDDNDITSENHHDFLRNICIDAVKFFFDYSLLDNTISYEQFETFFENDEDKKFYQYFFKSNNFSFKVRVTHTNPSVFYIYRFIYDSVYISPSLDKNNALNMSNSYLVDKFNKNYKNLLLDTNYSSTLTYDDIIEIYKFKYNYISSKGKINLAKGIYITVNASSAYIEEISLF